jgi:hypothetical protein
MYRVWLVFRVQAAIFWLGLSLAAVALPSATRARKRRKAYAGRHAQPRRRDGNGRHRREAPTPLFWQIFVRPDSLHKVDGRQNVRVELVA